MTNNKQSHRRTQDLKEPMDDITLARQIQKDYREGSDKIHVVAKRHGVTRTTASNLMRLLNLPDSVIKMVESGKLSGSHARTLLPIKEEIVQTNIALGNILNPISVRELEKLVQKLLDQGYCSATESTVTNATRQNRKTRIRNEYSVKLTKALNTCLLYTSPSPRDRQKSRMPSSA